MKKLNAVNIYLSISILILISFSSCSEDVITPDTRQQYQLRAWEYSDNHYFLDTLYKQSFADYYNNQTISSHTDSFAVDEQSFEVWVQTDITTVNYRIAGLHVDLPPLPVSGKYNDSLKTVPNPQQGVRLFGIVRKLDHSVYKLNKFAGYVSLKINLPDNYFAGVAYKRTKTGEQFGTSWLDSTALPTDTLVLKMVKVENLIPDNIVAWNLKLKNIYQLPVKPVLENGFEFNISYFYNSTYNSSLPGISTYLISILNLDKYSIINFGSPDNKFDFLPGFTIDTENGWIIFPDLKPFVNCLSNFSNPAIDPVYWYPELYTELKQVAKTAPNAERYLFSGYYNSIKQKLPESL